jgi:hypothetical protein
VGTKQQILKAIEELPDDAGVEDALDRLYLLPKVGTDVALTFRSACGRYTEMLTRRSALPQLFL